MKKNKQDKIKEALQELKEVNKWDNECVHSCYDKLMKAIAEKYAPDIKKEADKIVEGISFWYA